MLTTRETAKTTNVFANNISTDIKLSEAQISKIIQSSGSFGSWLGNLGKKTLKIIAIPLSRDNLLGLVSNLASNAMSKLEIKISCKGATRADKNLLCLFRMKIWIKLLKS